MVSLSFSMLKSIDTLTEKVFGPLSDTCGPNAKLLTVEAHTGEIRGLALCSGKVVRFVLRTNEEIFLVSNLLTLK